MIVTRADAERFRTVIGSRLGLRFDDGKLDELAETLRVRIRAVGASGVDGYVRSLDHAELAALAERLTVGETYFFRYHEQFSAFSEAVLPEVLRSGMQPRVLSAGCASGEEAYSLAMTMRDRVPVFEVRAFDVNPAALARAKAAKYTTWALRETPQAMRERYFIERSSAFELAPEVRSAVRFEQRNLIDEDPAFWVPDAFDVVFCRNVIMYFDSETMRAVVARIARSLRPDGFLFLGHAETLRGISPDFHLRHTHETFYYQRRSDASVSVPMRVVRTPTTELVPSALGLEDVSWIDVITHASDRVTKLANGARVSKPLPTTPPRDNGAALDMMRQERFAEALAILGAAGDTETTLLRAVILTNSGKLEDAERACMDLLVKDDLNAGAHYLMALCREHAGDRPAALEHDRMATYLDPAFVMPHVHLGLLERRAGNFDRASSELAVALELLPSEDASRILLFGGGFSRESLGLLCQSEMRRCEARK